MLSDFFLICKRYFLWMFPMVFQAILRSLKQLQLSILKSRFLPGELVQTGWFSPSFFLKTNILLRNSPWPCKTFLISPFFDFFRMSWFTNICWSCHRSAPIGAISSLEEFGRVFYTVIIDKTFGSFISILYPSVINKMFGSWVNIFQFLRNCDNFPTRGMFFKVSFG